MNALVVYDSHYGNTEHIAQTIAETLGAFGRETLGGGQPARSVHLPRPPR